MYPFRHANFRVHRELGRWDLGLRADYRPSFSSSISLEGNAGGTYASSNFRNWNYQAVGLGPIVRLNLGNERRMIFELDAFHRLWWFNRKQTSYDSVESHSFNGLRSERQQVTAVRLLWGGRGRAWRISSAKAISVEGLVGFGFRWKQLRYTTHEGVIGRNDFARTCAECIEASSYYTPSAHASVRIALVPRRDRGSAND